MDFFNKDIMKEAVAIGRFCYSYGTPVEDYLILYKNLKNHTKVQKVIRECYKAGVTDCNGFYKLYKTIESDIKLKEQEILKDD